MLCWLWWWNEGCEPGNVYDLWRLEKQRKLVLPWSLQEEDSPADTLVFMASDLWKYKINLVCFNPLSLWQQRKEVNKISIGSDAQSCLTLCNLMDCSPPVSSVHEILQARTLEQCCLRWTVLNIIGFLPRLMPLWNWVSYFPAITSVVCWQLTAEPSLSPGLRSQWKVAVWTVVMSPPWGAVCIKWLKFPFIIIMAERTV